MLSGLGLAHAPGWLFAHAIASGEVRRVLCGYEPDPLPIRVVHPAGRRLPAEVHVFIDFLAGLFAQDAYLTPRDTREETP